MTHHACTVVSKVEAIARGEVCVWMNNHPELTAVLVLVICMLMIAVVIVAHMVNRYHEIGGDEDET